MQIPDCIDIIIGEVKMRKAALKFNDPIRVHANRGENWDKILKWIGLFDEDEVCELSPFVTNLVKTKEKNVPDDVLQKAKTKEQIIEVIELLAPLLVEVCSKL